MRCQSHSRCERVRADQLVAQDAVDEVLEDHARSAPRRERDAFRARVRADPQDRALAVGRRSPQSLPPGERGLGRRRSVRSTPRDA